MTLKIQMIRSPQVDTSKFTPYDWFRHITPLVNEALQEAIKPEHLYQEYILSGVLFGLGKNPQEIIAQGEKGEKDGTTQ